MAELTDGAQQTQDRTSPTSKSPASPPAAPGFFQSSLSQRLFLLTAALIVLAVGTAVFLTRTLGNGVADRAVRENLERSTAVQSSLAEDRLDQLYLRALAVSGDPNFVAYLLAAINDGDVPSLTDQLDERQRDMGFSFAIVLDREGQVAARTDIRGGQSDFTDTAIFRAAMEGGDYSSDGLWARDGALYYAVLVPLTSSGVLEGYLIAAYELDDATALALRQTTGTEVTFVIDEASDDLSASDPTAPSVVATTLDPTESEALAAWLATAPTDDGEARELELARHRNLVTVRPIYDVEGAQIGRVVNLGSLEEALAPFRRIGSILAVVGAATVLLALIATYLLGRRMLEPIRQLAAAAQNAARGDLEMEIAGRERKDEVGQLAEAFSGLLSELREKRDMQLYLNELTRTLPEQENIKAEAVPATSTEATFVGIELRSYAERSAPGAAPRQVMDQLTQDLRRLSRAMAARGGEIEGVMGHRLMAVFEGERHAVRALSAAMEVPQLDPMAVIAITSGPGISGTVTWHNRPALAFTGPPVEELENLLRVSRVGTLLLSSSAHRALRGLLEELGTPAEEHRTQWSKEPLYALPTSIADKLAGSELGATVEMGTQGTISMQTTTSVGRMTLAAVGPGSILADRFQIISELGVGGMGIVYKARDRELEELVALKMLKHDAFAGDLEALDRLKDELKLARKISHPNVLRTFDFGDADGFPFISMEFVRGVTLKHLLDQSGRLPLSAGLHMARQLCRGLEAAHGQSVLHRDIKPENMIIEPTGNVKLMDFGIAQTIQRRRGSSDSEGPIVGTPYYLAPEQLEGLEPDVRADIYACGVVFFEIFTGQLPFPGGNLMQIIGRKINEDAPPPSTFWAEMPRDLEKIILTCLERDRDKRFANVSTLLSELETLRA